MEVRTSPNKSRWILTKSYKQNTLVDTNTHVHQPRRLHTRTCSSSRPLCWWRCSQCLDTAETFQEVSESAAKVRRQYLSLCCVRRMEMKRSSLLPTCITDSSVSEYFSSVCLISCRQHSRLSTPHFCCCCNSCFARWWNAQTPCLTVKSGLRLRSPFQDVPLSSLSLHRFHLLSPLHPPQSHISQHLHLTCHWSTYNTIFQQQ